MSKNKSTKKATTKVTGKVDLLKNKVKELTTTTRSKFDNARKRLHNPSKKKKKLTKAQQKQSREDTQHAILGIGLLLVVVSIAYSTSVIYIGVDSDASKIALIPQSVFALVTLFRAFSKLYK